MWLSFYTHDQGLTASSTAGYMKGGDIKEKEREIDRRVRQGA